MLLPGESLSLDLQNAPRYHGNPEAPSFWAQVQLWLSPTPPEALGPKGLITCSCILSRQQALCSTNGFFLGHGSKGIKGSDAVTKTLLDPEVRRCLMGEQSQAPRHLPKMIRRPAQRHMALPPSLPATKCLYDLKQSLSSQPCPHIKGSLRAGCHCTGALRSGELR